MKKDIVTRLKNEANNVPDVLEKIKKHPDFFVPEPKKKFMFKPRIKYAFLSVIMIILFTSISQPLKTEAIITMDINPSIEFQINKNERVIKITGLNNDGVELIKDIKYRGKHIENVLDSIIDEAINKNYIKEDDYILIGIESENEDFSEKISKKVDEKLKNKLKEKNKNSEVIVKKIKGNKNSNVSGNENTSESGNMNTSESGNMNTDKSDNNNSNETGNNNDNLSNTKRNLVNDVIRLTNYTDEDFNELAGFKVKDLYDLIKEEYIESIVEKTVYSRDDLRILSKMSIKELEQILEDNQ